MKKRIIVFLTLLIMILAVFMQNVFAVPPSNPHIDSGTAAEGGSFFQYYADGVYSDLKTPPHYVVETGEVAYCLEHNLESADGELYHSFDAVSLYSGTTYRGLLAILMNGYPYTNAGLTDQQARYATSNAIRSWLAESAGIGYRFMVPEYDLLRYKSGYYAVWAFYKQLLVYAREGSSAYVQYSVYTNPRTVTLTEQSGELKGAIVVSIQNCNNYTIDESKLPDGVTLSGYTGNNGDILTITAPLSYQGDTVTLDKVFIGNTNRASSSFFWLDASSAGTQSVVVTAVDSFTTAAYASFTFTSEGPAEGYIEIYKTDEATGLPLEGAVFQILDSDNNEVSQLSTNVEGYAISELLEVGFYSVKEVTAPDGYVLNDTAAENVEVTADHSTALNLTNRKQTGTIRITKADAETGDLPRGDAVLNGAVFEIYDSNSNLVEILDCGNNNYAVSGELPLGTYTIKEVTAPSGYTLDNTEYSAVIEYTEQTTATNTIDVNVGNEVIKGSISIQKTVDVLLAEWTANNEEYPLSGIEFNIVHKATGNLIETLVTDNNGFDQSSLLPYGTYTVSETSYLYGYYIAEPQDVFINEDNAAYELTIENQAVKSKVRLVKTDTATGETIQTAGTQFQLRDINNSIVTLDNQSIFTTDDTGTVLLPEPLPFGDYTLHEITPPYGYWLDSNPISFSTGGSKGETLTVAFSDDKILKNISVIKTDENDTIRMLPGAVFNIYSGNVLVDSITTNNDGTALSKELPAGNYIIKEVLAPSGFILDDTEYAVTISDDETIVYTLHIANCPIEVALIKTDSINDSPVEGSDIEIYDSENNPAASGTTDINGQIILSELPAGDYTFKETNAPDGYILSNEIYSFSIDEYGNAAGTTEFTNEPTAVKILKVIYETSEPLSGAGFVVKGNLGLITYSFSQNADGSYHYDKNGEVQEIMVNENGETVIYGLPSGSYWLEENTVPVGYYPCAPAKFIVDDTQNTEAPLEIIIPNSEYVNLGLDRDRWYLPAAIAAIVLLLFAVVVLFIMKKPNK
ncbi:MAG: Cys-Gln thioester bond-forming surface protein [Clostridia bacterium]|nr:Cys-Gln thioester bond-forming surface protein [Clostridia bacterium]